MAIKLDAAGIRKSANAKRMQREAYKAWFVGLTFNVVAGLYTLFQLRQREQGVDKNDGEGVVESKKLARYAFCGGAGRPVVGLRLTAGAGDDDGYRADNERRERTATNIQLISDLCDLTVPSSALDYVNLDDGIVGLAGTVSSLLGVWSQWKKTA